MRTCWGDEQVFPLWARNLPRRLRDRVLYGAIGLTEYDELLRTSLLRLPPDRRRVAWEAHKNKRKGAGMAPRPSRSRNGRNPLSLVAATPYKWNLIRRMERLSQIRVVELHDGTPPGEWPESCRDLTEDLNTTAKHILGGLHPPRAGGRLDPVAAESALWRRNKEISASPRSSLRSRALQSTVGPNFEDTLRTMERDREEQECHPSLLPPLSLDFPATLVRSFTWDQRRARTSDPSPISDTATY